MPITPPSQEISNELYYEILNILQLQLNDYNNATQIINNIHSDSIHDSISDPMPDLISDSISDSDSDPMPYLISDPDEDLHDSDYDSMHDLISEDSDNDTVVSPYFIASIATIP